MKFSFFMMPLHDPRENPTLAFERDISLIHLADMEAHPYAHFEFSRPCFGDEVSLRLGGRGNRRRRIGERDEE